MRMMQKIITELLILSLIIGIVMGDCKIAQEDADSCGEKIMIFGYREMIIPSNEEEMNHQCTVILDNIRCLRDYTASCLSNFPQQVLNMILTTAGKHIETRCNNPSEKAKYLGHIKCFLPKSDKIEPLHICADKHIIQMENIKDLSFADHIPASCCVYHYFQQCILSHSEKLCGAESADYFQLILDEITDDALSFACGDYQTIADCDKLMKPEIWTSLKDVANSDDANVLASRHKFKSIFLPVINIVEKFYM